MQANILKSGFNLPQSLILNFAKIRADSESYLRRRGRKEEIKFEEIYELIGKVYKLDRKQLQDLMALEIQTEYDSIYPVSRTISFLEKLRMEEERIVFISDIYLPLETIKNFLIKVNAYNGEKIYLSSETGKTKFSGNLFKYVIESEGCKPSEMTHFGDNLIDDVIVPSRLGIKVFPLSRLDYWKFLLKYYLKRIKSFIFSYIYNIYKLKAC